MKSLILVSALLVGFSASASICKVSEATVERIESMKDSNLMAKPKVTTIKALVAADACVASYLKENDAAALAREIIALKIIPAEQILNFFVEHAEEKLNAVAPKTCDVSSQTLEQVEELRTSGMHVKALYVSMKSLLDEDNCLSSELSQGEMAELAQRIVFETTDLFSAEAMISQALNK